MNSRFSRTYLEHIEEVHLSASMIPNCDQLYNQRFKQGHYPGYQEPEIKFMPTYKRDANDNRIYINKKNQCPSYTDRILYKNNTQCAIDVQSYECIDNQFGSDHRPVCLNLTVYAEPIDFINPSILFNTLIPDQGRGEVLIQNMSI